MNNRPLHHYKWPDHIPFEDDEKFVFPAKALVDGIVSVITFPGTLLGSLVTIHRDVTPYKSIDYGQDTVEAKVLRKNCEMFLS